MDARTVEAARCQAERHKLFSTASRILIVWALADRELSVSEVASAIGASLQNTSQHLQLLKSRGVVLCRRQGNMILYRLHPQLEASSELAPSFTQYESTERGDF